MNVKSPTPIINKVSVAKSMNSYFNNNEIIEILSKRKKHIALITIVAIGLSTLFSSSVFIKPKFKSYAVIYPSNIAPYSIESETEQMLQIINSDDIIYEMDKKFQLGKHYEIDSKDPHYKTYLKEEYRENVTIQKTSYESVEIEILDTDPKRAYDMVNELINLFNLKVRSLHKEKSFEVVHNYQEFLANKEKEIDSLVNAIQQIRVKYGILEYEVQAKEATRRYLRTLGPGSAKFNELTTILRNLEEKGEEFQELKTHLDASRENYEKVKAEYEIALRDFNKEFTYANVVTAPTIADKKSYPVRWIIVLISALSATFLAILFFTFTDSSVHKERSPLVN